MRMDKMTHRLQNALADAQSLALGRDNSSLMPAHLLSVLVDDRQSSVVPLLTRAGVRMAELPVAIGKALNDLPTLKSPTGEVAMSAELAKVLNLADRAAQQAGDQYVGTEQVLMALLEDQTVAKILSQCGLKASSLPQLIAEARGGESVSDPNAEESRQALSKYTIDLTERAEDFPDTGRAVFRGEASCRRKIPEPLEIG